MAPRNGTATTPARLASSSLRWLTRTFRASREQVRPPRRPHLAPPRPRWLSSFLTARVAVQAGASLESFLRQRLASRLAALAVPPSRLPVRLGVEGGAIQAQPSEPAPPAWLAAFARAESAAEHASELQHGQAEAARLAALVEAQRARAEAEERELEAAIGGAELADPSDELHARRMGRPGVPAPLGLWLQLAGGVFLASTAWQLAPPCLALAGVDPRHAFTAGLERDPAGVGAGLALALGAVTALFLLALAVAEGGARLLDAAGPRRSALGALGAAALASGLALALTAARAAAGRPTDDAALQRALAVLTLALPLVAAQLVRAGRRLEAARRDAMAAARGWDDAHQRTYQALSRRAARVAEAQRRLQELEEARAEVLDRLQALRRRAATTQRLAADLADADAQDMARLAQGLLAALELDRYEFLRQSAARGRQLDAPGLARAKAEDSGRNLGLAG